MAVDSSRGTKKATPKKMSSKEKKINQTVNDAALGKTKKKKKKNGAK